MSIVGGLLFYGGNNNDWFTTNQKWIFLCSTKFQR